MKPAHMRSPELARWLSRHRLAGCLCTWLPTGKAGWYLYRVVNGCTCDHSEPWLPTQMEPAAARGH